MASYLLDTSIIIDALNERNQRPELIRELLARGDRLASCAITVAEVHAGMRPAEQPVTGRFVSSLEYYDMNYEVAETGGHVKAEWARKGVTLSLADVLIAATAMTYGLTLITDNIRHFPMTGLRLHTFIDPN